MNYTKIHGKKILILGSGGSGKSTLARNLSKVLNIPVIHMDREFWMPDWTPTEESVWRARQEQWVQNESWIIDGNYWKTLDIRLSQADTVIFLDISRWICIARILKRWYFRHGKNRIDMANGCPEKMDLKFLKTIWNFHKKYKPAIEKQISNYPHVKVILLSGINELKEFTLLYQ